MRILASDPGVTTGIAYLSGNGWPANTLRIHQIRPEDFPQPHATLYDFLSEIKPDKILYEPFHYRQGVLGAVFKGVEYIGIIELWAQHHNVEAIKINPSDGKGFWDMKKIKAMNLWTPGHPHGMDALRLLLTWLMKNDEDFKMLAFEKLKGL